MTYKRLLIVVAAALCGWCVQQPAYAAALEPVPAVQAPVLAVSTIIAEVNWRGWGFVDWLRAVVIVAACIGIVLIALKVFGIEIPGWAIQIFWIVVVAVVALAAISIVSSM
jgi:hypothetical protein